MLALEKCVRECALEAKRLEVVKMRASQINGCAYCIDMHSKRREGAGRDRTTPLGIERIARDAALQRAGRWRGTEAVTLASQTHLPDEVYEAAREHFSEKDCWI